MKTSFCLLSLEKTMKVMKKSTKKRVHLVNLLRWRSTVAFVACLVTILFSLGGVGYSFVSVTLKEVREMFKWFTIDSNILTALAATMIVPYAVEGMSRKRLTYPKWLQRIHYAGTICLTLTMVFAVLFISWFDPVIAFGGANFFLHIICPLMILVSFFMVESGYKLDRKDNLLAIIPVAAYGGLYYYNVILTGNWDDHYHLNEYIPFFVSTLLMLVLVYLIGWGIRSLYNRLLSRREKVMKQIWDDDELDPVSIKIEIYSLGVHAGSNEEKDSVSIPFDILEEVSDRFDIKLEELSKAYMRGALDGLKEKETGNTNI